MSLRCLVFEILGGGAEINPPPPGVRVWPEPPGVRSQSETCGRSRDLVGAGLVDWGWGQKLGKLLGIFGKGSKVKGRHIFQALQDMG